MVKSHRSHISSSRAKARGWSRVPSYETRLDTYNLKEEVGTNYMDDYLSLTCTTTNAGATTFGDAVDTTDYYTWGGSWNDYRSGDTYQPVTIVKEIIKEKVVTKEVEQRTLYRVYVVDPRKGGQILLNGEPVIAKNENQAMLKVGILTIAEKVGREIEDLDVYVEEVGTFIRPKKDTQRVKVVKTDEED